MEKRQLFQRRRKNKNEKNSREENREWCFNKEGKREKLKRFWGIFGKNEKGKKDSEAIAV